jgi:hypothetical protein
MRPQKPEENVQRGKSSDKPWVPRLAGAVKISCSDLLKKKNSSVGLYLLHASSDYHGVHEKVGTRA